MRCCSGVGCAPGSKWPQLLTSGVREVILRPPASPPGKEDTKPNIWRKSNTVVLWLQGVTWDSTVTRLDWLTARKEDLFPFSVIMIFFFFFCVCMKSLAITPLLCFNYPPHESYHNCVANIVTSLEPAPHEHEQTTSPRSCNYISKATKHNVCTPSFEPTCRPKCFLQQYHSLRHNFRLDWKTHFPQMNCHFILFLFPFYTSVLALLLSRLFFFLN